MQRKLPCICVAPLLIVACTPNQPDPPGVAVDLVLVDATAAAPALVNGQCVVFTPRPTPIELCHFNIEPVPTIFSGIGRSILQCMSGAAEPYLSEVPAGAFYAQRLFINVDGECPPGDSGCYWPLNPTVDRSQTNWSTDPAYAQWQLEALIGHEVWHAVDADFDGSAGSLLCLLPVRAHNHPYFPRAPN